MRAIQNNNSCIKIQGFKMKENKKFPFGRLIWAGFLGGTTIAGGAFYPQEYWKYFILGFFIQLFFSCIPVFIAYSKDSKHKNIIYNMSTILPITILVIAAIIWALFDKKETNKSKSAKRDNVSISLKTHSQKNSSMPTQIKTVAKKRFSRSAKVSSAL